MPALPGVEFIEGDFNEQATLDRLAASLGGSRADLVLSDMAPNMLGMSDVDHDRSMQLVELAVDLLPLALRPGGDFLVKVFQGRDFQPLLARLRSDFETVKTRKPKASRSRSAELYVLARGYRLV
jgi:23S rRNA (uridine2552-2'-O)-methyltransferase